MFTCITSKLVHDYPSQMINKSDDVVSEMIDGMLLSTSALKRVEGQNILIRADIDMVRKTKVTIISGGGSGHEPAHAGLKQL